MGGRMVGTTGFEPVTVSNELELQQNPINRYLLKKLRPNLHPNFWVSEPVSRRWLQGKVHRIYSRSLF